MMASEIISRMEQTGAQLLDVDDPVRFPQLTDPALRFDEMHLDQKGAAVYTACLAELFVEYLSQLDDG